jgi:hypothetical protein
MAMHVIFGGQSVFEQQVDLSEPVSSTEFFDNGIAPHQHVSARGYASPTRPPPPQLEALYVRDTVQLPHSTASTANFEESYSGCPVRMADFIPDISRCHQTCHEDFVDAGIKPSAERESPG